ncbi:MAG TPA: PorV/PorQ family protein [Bacteroidota bacterium]|nr:PorV/PorQ family protein [Bacteroidota bacterium]
MPAATYAPGRRLLMSASLVCGLTLLSISGAIAGRGDKVGAASATQLSIPVGGRSISLAGSILSTVGGAEAIFWNPAGLVRTGRSTELMFSHMSYLAGIGVEYAAVGKRIGGGASVGISLKALSVGEIPVTTELFPDGTGETTSPTFLVLGAAFSRKMSDQIAVGVSANVIHESMAEVSATGIAFTGGVQYARLGGVDGLSVGVVIRNIGPKLVYDGDGLERTGIINGSGRGESNYKVEAASADLPSTIEVGLGYLYRLNDPIVIAFSSQFQNNNFSDDEYKFGAEFTYDERLFLRAGYDYSTEAEGNESLYGPAFGLGVVQTLQNVLIQVDYAYRTVRHFSGNHVITITLGF